MVNMDKGEFTIHEFAEIFGVSHVTVRNWIRKGVIETTVVSWRGLVQQKMIPMTEIEKIKARQVKK